MTRASARHKAYAETPITIRVALLGVGKPADALTINPIFDAAFRAAARTNIMNVITEYQNDFSKPGDR
jgi:hypothetical protein